MFENLSQLQLEVVLNSLESQVRGFYGHPDGEYVNELRSMYDIAIQESVSRAAKIRT